MGIRRHLEATNRIIESLATFFGFSLRRSLAVLLFARSSDFSRIFGSHAQGMALVGSDCVLLAADHCCAATIAEITRHEVAHLFAGYWNSLADPFCSEGLAMCLEGTILGRPVDYHALVVLSTYTSLTLSRLLDPTYFLGEACLQCHLLAGSFTGFLIRQFGLDKYRAFYREAHRGMVVIALERFYGSDLCMLEAQWHADLFSRRGHFEPDLARACTEAAFQASKGVFYLFRDSSILSEKGDAGAL